MDAAPGYEAGRERGAADEREKSLPLMRDMVAYIKKYCANYGSDGCRCDQCVEGKKLSNRVDAYKKGK